MSKLWEAHIPDARYRVERMEGDDRGDWYRISRLTNTGWIAVSSARSFKAIPRVIQLDNAERPVTLRLIAEGSVSAEGD